MKKTWMSLSVLAVLCATAAHAEDAAPASPITANVALTSNYKYRGQDQGNNKAAIQGGFDYSIAGFYIGNWNSSIGFTGSGIESDLYGGYKGTIGDFGYDVGVLQYYYAQGYNFNTTEVYGAVSYSIVTLKYSGTTSKDYFGLGAAASPAVKGRGTGYWDLSANYEIAKGLTLNGHVGYTALASDLKNSSAKYPNYTDYKVGVTYDFGGGLTLSGAAVGADHKNFYGDINKGQFIVTLAKVL